MSALKLRRLGFAATLLTGLALTGSAVHGVSGMDATLELAASPADRPVFVSHHHADGECDGPPDDRRLNDRRLS
jgi:hypothetical protein